MTTRPDVKDEAIVDFRHHSGAFNLNELALKADLGQTARWLRRRITVASVGYIADERQAQPYGNRHHWRSTTQGAT